MRNLDQPRCIANSVGTLHGPELPLTSQALLRKPRKYDCSKYAHHDSKKRTKIFRMQEDRSRYWLPNHVPYDRLSTLESMSLLGLLFWSMKW